jgi:hypothetical protein
MSTNLLINEPPLQVLPSLATRIGLNEAIIVQQVHYWLNPRHNENYSNGRHWVYNTYDQWGEQFPFWGKNTIRRSIESLEKKKILISYMKPNSFQNIKYYTVDYDQLDLITSEQDKINPKPESIKPAENMDFSPSAQNGQIDGKRLNNPTPAV